MRICRKGRRFSNVPQNSTLWSEADSRPLFCDESYGKGKGKREDFRFVSIARENDNNYSLSRCTKRSKNN